MIVLQRSLLVTGAEPVPITAAITTAGLDAQAAATRALVGSGFTVIVEHPFVIAGDEAEAVVRDRATRIVRWSSDKLRQDFFAHDPDGVHSIYLFKDADSYTANALRLFQETPTSRFGYCSSAHRALVMNIATGGGTLVHEMVHAFMHGNIPQCPDWLNEGLASLFEHSEERHGHIIGTVNGRLQILQTAITNGSVPSWQHLTSLPDRVYYLDGAGANYGTARYLLYYLQEHQLLHTFWTTWLARRDEDPTGLDTLLSLFPTQDPAVLERDWRQWILTLTAH